MLFVSFVIGSMSFVIVPMLFGCRRFKVRDGSGGHSERQGKGDGEEDQAGRAPENAFVVDDRQQDAGDDWHGH